MDHSSAPTKTARPRGGTVSRRAVVRTAAWTAPVVTIAAAAPAHAAASDVLLITGTTAVWQSNNSSSSNYRDIDATVTIRNQSANEATSNLQVTVTIPAAYRGGGATGGISVSGVSGGWSTSIGASGASVTFTRTGAQLPYQNTPPGNDIRILAFTIDVNTRPASPRPAMPVVATSTGFVSGAGNLNP